MNRFKCSPRCNLRFAERVRALSLASAEMTTPLTDQELIDAVDQLPPIAGVMRRLLAVLQDPNSDVDDICRLVRVDTALVAQVLRLANSPAYARAERVSSLEQAVQQVGINEVTRLVSALGARQLFSRQLDLYKISAPLLWLHTLGVAVGAEIVATHYLTDAGAAYLAGMLHMIGMVALDRAGTQRQVAARPTTTPLPDWERETFGADNAEIAARVLQHWNFPEEMGRAVSQRYVPPTSETVSHPDAVLFLASCLAERVPAGLPPEAGMFRLTPEQLAALGLNRELFSELELETNKKYSSLRALLSAA